MTTTTKPTMRPEALEAFRYRRKLLTSKRTYQMRLIALQTQNMGKPYGNATRRLRHIEAQIRAYNEVAEEYDLPQIRG